MRVHSFLNASYTRIDAPYSSAKASSVSEKKSDETSNSTELTSSEKALVSRLQAKDTAVKAHERAHISAGAGVILSGATFVYQKAPDERLYAIGGEVAIDTAPENEPEATVKKMQLVRAAALAPSDPSPTDYQVAATASMLQMQARLEMARAMQNELLGKAKEAYQANNTPQESHFSNYA
ncbi:MAG: hypothetical protein KBE79_00915 [Sulfurospirillum sp.]|jgi:hypothetical protein|nr:hypothetical protein [Sulfurospirillum sp.]MBP9491751.1 hypothetical protein [Sulfurospirillum sp.]MBP9612057.1 hypothetical protein [Sulfurospirillum sp.]